MEFAILQSLIAVWLDLHGRKDGTLQAEADVLVWGRYTDGSQTNSHKKHNKHGKIDNEQNVTSSCEVIIVSLAIT